MLKKWFRTGLRLGIVSPDPERLLFWQQEIQSSQVPLQVEAHASLHPSNRSCSAWLVVEPDQECLKQIAALQERDTDLIFIILGKEFQTSKLTTGAEVCFLPAHTHPLELARLLVEKLNLPAVSKKTAYAATFFNF
ncbi:MAG TPA: hypothetical protein PKE63_11895 [Lacibacter sp.]|nr:hypothetical protein [Lacibacter sp.]HMO89998.1 hypothetical protein [Lacibacter sp.]HMP87971.1 hypothetical protein [Lacibacter sp.]